MRGCRRCWPTASAWAGRPRRSQRRGAETPGNTREDEYRKTSTPRRRDAGEIPGKTNIKRRQRRDAGAPGKYLGRRISKDVDAGTPGNTWEYRSKVINDSSDALP